MFKRCCWSCAVLLTLLGASFLANSANSQRAAIAADAPAKKLLRHVVLFKFKDDINKQQVDEVVKAFAALPDKIDTIHDFEWGTDVSVENKAEGFTHLFLVTFRSEQGRATYLPHAAHQEFVRLVGPRLDKVLVVDYWARSE